MKREVLFTIEGFRPGYKRSCKRGIKIRFEDDDNIEWTPENFMMQFRAALAALYRHEAQCLGIEPPYNLDLKTP